MGHGSITADSGGPAVMEATSGPVATTGVVVVGKRSGGVTMRRMPMTPSGS